MSIAARSSELAVRPLELLQDAREVVQADGAGMRRARTSRTGRSARCWSTICVGLRARRARGTRARSSSRSSAAERKRPVVRRSAGACGRRRRTPRSASTARRSAAVSEPGMPLITSLAAEPAERVGDAARRRARTSWRACAIIVVGWLITAGRPLDRVDLGEQRRVDQPRALEELLVRPARVRRPAAGRRSRCARATKSVASMLRPSHQPGHLARVELPGRRDRRAGRRRARPAACRRLRARTAAASRRRRRRRAATRPTSASPC